MPLDDSYSVVGKEADNFQTTKPSFSDEQKHFCVQMRSSH